jgi:hypothetical protein
MQMVPPVMTMSTRDSGYCVAMVFARLRSAIVSSRFPVPCRAPAAARCQLGLSKSKRANRQQSNYIEFQ